MKTKNQEMMLIFGAMHEATTLGLVGNNPLPLTYKGLDIYRQMRIEGLTLDEEEINKVVGVLCRLGYVSSETKDVIEILAYHILNDKVEEYMNRIKGVQDTIDRESEDEE